MVMLSSNKPLVETYTISPVSCRIRQWFCVALSVGACSGLNRNPIPIRKRGSHTYETAHKSGNGIVGKLSDADNKKLRKIVGRARFAQNLNCPRDVSVTECCWALHFVFNTMLGVSLLLFATKETQTFIKTYSVGSAGISIAGRGQW